MSKSYGSVTIETTIRVQDGRSESPRKWDILATESVSLDISRAKKMSATAVAAFLTDLWRAVLLDGENEIVPLPKTAEEEEEAAQ